MKFYILPTVGITRDMFCAWVKQAQIDDPSTGVWLTMTQRLFSEGVDMSQMLARHWPVIHGDAAVLSGLTALLWRQITLRGSHRALRGLLDIPGRSS